MTGILFGMSLVAGAALGWPAVIVCLGIAGIACVTSGQRARWTALLVVFALIGAFRVHERPILSVPGWIDKENVEIGQVASGPIETGREQRFEVLLHSFNGEDSARLCASSPLLPMVGLGDRIWFKGDVTLIDELDRRDTGYLRSRGCSGWLEIDLLEVREQGSGFQASLDHIRRNLTTVLQSAAPGDPGSLMAGLVTGDDAGLSSSKRNAFITTGTSHITAVSGSNLAVIVTLLTFLGHATGRGRTLIWQVGVVAALWAYVAVIGLSPPPFRAALVATLALVAIKLGRRPDFVTLSLVAASIQLIVRPADFETLAFRLSTVAAIALVLGLSQRSPHGFRGWISHIVIGTAATQAATSILLIPLFGQFTLYAIPANIVVATLCSVAFPVALVGGLTGLASQTLADSLVLPALLPINGALSSVEFIANFPFADSGAAIAALLPAWGWTVICLGVVVLISRECRGGVVRFARGLASLDVERKSEVLVTSAAVMIGTLAGVWFTL